MSIILITNHNESIYNVTKETRRYIKKSPRYKSTLLQYARKGPILSDVRDNIATIKPHATMGIPEEVPPDPCDFLRKGTGMKRIKQTTKTMQREMKSARHKCMNKDRIFPSPEEVEKYDKEKEAKTAEKKDFITKNIKFVLRMKPKEPEQNVVINRFGESKPLKKGLEPIYIKDPVYGRTPRYLQNFIHIMQKNYQKKRDASGVEQPKCRYVTREERDQLLQGLKQNWEELQKQYQGLPILTDTIPKMNRKAKMEADLKQLEKDIVLIERHPYIYVYNDQEHN